MTYWSSAGDARIFAGQGQFVYALSAQTGKPIEAFGREGRIDLREDLGRDPSTQSVLLTSPGVIYQDLLIVGGRVSEGLPASPGDIRAYDVKSGVLRWAFHTIPRPGEFGYDTWPTRRGRIREASTTGPGWRLTARAASSTRRRDPRRPIFTAPTGLATICSPTRSSRSTRRRAGGWWHFQAVHHDIWDRDFPSPPSLVTVSQGGRRIDAVAQTTKHGFVFLFDRASGTPLFPIEASRFPESTVDGERAAATQPLPTRPAPFARQLLTEQMLTTRTPAGASGRARGVRTFRSDGQFVPLSVGRQTVIFPGFDGGAEWGGSAFDPESGLLYVNATRWRGPRAWRPTDTEKDGGGRQTYLASCASCHRDDMIGTPPQIPSLVAIGQRRSADELNTIIRQGAGRMPGFPALPPAALGALVTFLRTGESDRAGHDTSAIAMTYRFTGYRKFLDPDGYPAIAPPWGTLSAINLSTGEYAWKIPLGEYPELAAQGITNTGSENYGGSGGHRGRDCVHCGHQLRQEGPRVRQDDRRAAVGGDTAACRECDPLHVRGRRAAVSRRPGRRREVEAERAVGVRRDLCGVRVACEVSG